MPLVLKAGGLEYRRPVQVGDGQDSCPMPQMRLEGLCFSGVRLDCLLNETIVDLFWGVRHLLSVFGHIQLVCSWFPFFVLHRSGAICDAFQLKCSGNNPYLDGKTPQQPQHLLSNPQFPARNPFNQASTHATGVRSLVPVLEMRERDGGVLERLGLDENSLGQPLRHAALLLGLCGLMKRSDTPKKTLKRLKRWSCLQDMVT